MVIGTVLSERYRLDERIASGGMGSVYAATDQRLERKVAVKLLKEGLAEDPTFIERFRREARAAGALSHPNIAAVYDFGSDDRCHYMVMELAPGQDLSRVLRDEGPLDPDRARSIAAQIAAALTHAHAAGVVHRDIKPPNVILDANDNVKVTDFGIARAAGDATLTATGSVLGSAHYISPEQAGGAEVGPATDIYSLGIVLYEMLTGTVPFTGDSIVAVAMRHVSDDVPPPSELRTDVPQHLDQVVRRATMKDPHERYATAAELRSALLSDEGDATAVGGPVGATERIETTVWPIPGSRWDPQKVGRNVLIVLGLLVATAFALLLLRLGSAEQPSAATDRQEEQAQSEEPSPETNEEGVTIPTEIVGEKVKDVEKALEEAGLVVTTEPVASEEFEKDRVITSSPEPGSTVAPGDTVTLQVSSGAPEEGDDDEDEEDEGEDEHPGKGNAHGKGKKDD